MRISKLKILDSVPFNAEDNVVITFDNQQEQYEFFDDHTYLYFENVMFVKGFLNKKIKLDVKIDQISYCNYVMFINKEFDNTKWIYAYIKNFEYISDGCTYIEIEIDYIQTFMKEIVFSNSLIDRQMVRDDSLGNAELFIPEDEISAESYIITNTDSYIENEWKVCVCYKPNLILEKANDLVNILSSQLSGGSDYSYRDFLDRTKPYYQYFNAGGGILNKYVTGCAYRIYNINSQSDLDTLVNDVWKLEILGYSILNIYMIPKNLNNIVSEESFYLISTKNPYFTNKEINVYANAYKPINNKCFTSPYIYLEISNFQGDIKKYNYQYFLIKQSQNPTFKFTILKSFLNRFDAVIYPTEYKTRLEISQATYDYGVSIGNAPECQWNSSMANATKMIAKTAFDYAVASAGAGIAEGAGASVGVLQKAEFSKNANAIGGALNTTLNNQDPSSKGVEGLPILQVLYNKIGWVFRQYACTNIAYIDQYFSMYGYKLNENDNPNVLGNKRFNYVRMFNPRIFGTIPLNAKNAIIEKLKQGVTFWHDKERFTYGNFTGVYSNEIIDKDLVNGKIFRN